MQTEFDKIAGYKEEKEALKELTKLIANRDKLKSMGGKLPRGLFLIGPNGTGKTILAKSFIKESKVNYITVDANDIEDDDEFTPYIKSKLDEASKKTPCIIFIDEIDKLIGNGEHFFAQSNFDRSRTLLNEINNHADVEGLFYLFVANEEYDLDYSMIRSGRIDRIINIKLPNEDEREEIFNYYLKNVKHDNSIDVKRLAIISTRFSGADIESLINNAVIKAFTNDKECISQEELMTVYFDKVFTSTGKEKKYTEEKLKAIAYHEAGHAVSSLILQKDAVSYVSILGRGSNEGFVLSSRSERRHIPMSDKLKMIKVGLSGLITEDIYTNDRSDGAQYDIQQAKKLAGELVRIDGYCGLDKICIMPRGPFEDVMVTISNSKRLLIEQEEDKIVTTCYQEAKELIESHRHLVELIAEKLLEKKSLDRDELLAIYENSHEPIKENTQSTLFAKEAR